MKNLNELLNKLNAHDVYGDESLFRFQTRVENGLIHIFDANENYHIDYLEEMNCLMRDASEEFGFDFEPQLDDKIMNQITEAVKVDFGKDAYIEWENNVVMVVAK